MKITRQELNDLFRAYTGKEVEDTAQVNLDAFTYLEAYDAYYRSTTDTGYSHVLVTDGTRTPDGRVTLTYRLVTLQENGEGGYLFLSNKIAT